MTQTHAHSHPHADGCGCDHAHDHEHGQASPSLGARWALSILIVTVLLIFLRPFIVGQMLVRVASYSANSSFRDAVRICRRIIAIDSGNVRAWTSLGYADMDLSRIDLAIPAFEKAVSLNPDDNGAASFELGQAYYTKGDFRKAIEYFERVRGAGPRAGVLLEADVLKYRHGTLGFRSLNSMQALLGALVECYKGTGDPVKAAEVQKEFDYYKSKHSRVLF